MGRLKIWTIEDAKYGLQAIYLNRDAAEEAVRDGKHTVSREPVTLSYFYPEDGDSIMKWVRGGREIRNEANEATRRAQEGGA